MSDVVYQILTIASVIVTQVAGYVQLGKRIERKLSELGKRLDRVEEAMTGVVTQAQHDARAKEMREDIIAVRERVAKLEVTSEIVR